LWFFSAPRRSPPEETRAGALDIFCFGTKFCERRAGVAQVKPGAVLKEKTGEGQGENKSLGRRK
jgi:hypothetical protein